MHPPPPACTARAALGLVVAVALVVLLGGCGSPDPARVVTAGQVVDGSATAYVGDHPVIFMVPSGRVTVTVGDPVSEVAGIDTGDGDAITAAPHSALVGVTWTLDRGAYPNAVNYQVAAPITVLAVPRDIDLTLVAGDDRYAVPGVGTMAGLEGRPSTTVWVVVHAGAPSYAVDLGYDGVTQTGDVTTGKVDEKQAAPLYEPLPVDHTGTCTVAGGSTASCLLDYAVGYPYVDGVGWARLGTTFALVGVHTEGAVSDMTLDGAAETTTVSDESTTFHVFAVGLGTHPLAVHAEVDRDGTLQVLSAHLAQHLGRAAS